MAEAVSPQEEPSRPGEEESNYPLFRQASIYTLTLDEFQHTVCEPGKNFGSMNMDEFLNNIWTAEENANATGCDGETGGRHREADSGNRADSDGRIARQSSLSHQGSLSVPAPLCRKTVEEVWSEIQRDQHQEERQSSSGNLANDEVSEHAPRQPTFGEMTLEDFLIKAGVVREGCGPSSTQQKYAAFGNDRNEEANYGQGMNLRFADHRSSGCGAAGYPTYVPPPPPLQQQGGGSGGIVGEGGSYVGNGKSNGSGFGGVCYGGRPAGGNGYKGAMGSPVSPLSSDIGQAEMGGMRSGRKRIFDGPIEKVVERRQRRMIKNRESAARSRARKQAYTVELEAELNHLKEENTQLRREMEELVDKRRRRTEAMKRVQEVAKEAEQAKKKLRRVKSWPS
ncbi:protein ABSCISIC ACID-INSENSITIVE 5-like [Aristolochia californica]|uniref:protein ABSCISIC ACID-INSENSITIVE 5-like n=1 Tax=Aristolochia californica TaxID=171875 RepID=UPI0035DF6FE3